MAAEEKSSLLNEESREITTYLGTIINKISSLWRLLVASDLWQSSDSNSSNRVRFIVATITNIISALAKAASATFIGKGIKMIAMRVTRTVILGIEFSPAGIIITGIIFGVASRYSERIIRWIINPAVENLAESAYRDLLNAINAVPLDEYDSTTLEARQQISYLYSRFQQLADASFLNVQPNFTNMLAGTGVAFYINPGLGLITVVNTGLLWFVNETLSYCFNRDETHSSIPEFTRNFTRTAWNSTSFPIAVRNYDRAHIETNISIQSYREMANVYRLTNNNDGCISLILGCLGALSQIGYVIYLASDGFQQVEIEYFTFILTHLSLAHNQITNNSNSITRGNQALSQIEELNKKKKTIIDKTKDMTFLTETKNSREVISIVSKNRGEALRPTLFSTRQPLDICVRNLHYTYPRSTTPVFSNINLSVNHGELILITDPSGKGKTTLLKLIAGLLTPSKGQIDLGKVLSDNNGHKKLASFVTYIPQITELYRNKPVMFNMLYSIAPDDAIAAIYDMKTSSEIEDYFRDNNLLSYWDICIEKLEQVKLKELAGKNDSRLSGGEMHRISFARGLAKNTNIILCDEVTGNLDRASATIIASLIINAKHVTRIVATHQPDLFSECKEARTLGIDQLEAQNCSYHENNF